jgi:hypothetical protein
VEQTPCIWKIKGTRAVQHRIIWWMVDAGAAGHVLLFGWQAQCANDIGIHRITLHRQVEVMIGKGMLFAGKKKGEVMLNPDIFRPQVNQNRFRKMRLP